MTQENYEMQISVPINKAVYHAKPLSSSCFAEVSLASIWFILQFLNCFL